MAVPVNKKGESLRHAKFYTVPKNELEHRIIFEWIVKYMDFKFTDFSSKYSSMQSQREKALVHDYTFVRIEDVAGRSESQCKDNNYDLVTPYEFVEMFWIDYCSRHPEVDTKRLASLWYPHKETVANSSCEEEYVRPNKIVYPGIGDIHNACKKHALVHEDYITMVRGARLAMELIQKLNP